MTGIRAAQWLLLLYALIFPAYCEDPKPDACALKVSVLGDSGRPEGSTFVDLLDAAGNVVFRGKTKDGELEICDFGFGIHSLRVGVSECFPVTVSNIKLVPGRTEHLRVLINGCPQWPDHRTGCDAYLRIRSLEGVPIQGAEVTVPGSDRWRWVADHYGRVTLPVGPKSQVTVAIRAGGFQEKVMTLGCKDVEDVDRTVTLTKE